MSKVVLEDIRAKDVEAFSRQESTPGPWGSVIPISFSRARAWARNPHANPDDVVLIVARMDGHCAGYIGLVPSRLQIHDRLEAINWVSTFFVPQGLRNQALGYLLLKRAISIGRPLAVVEPSAAAEKLSLAVGFKPLPYVHYLELDLLRDRNWLALPLRAIRRTLTDNDRRIPPSLDAAIAACSRPTAYALLSSLLFSAGHRLGQWQTKPMARLPLDAAPTTAGDVHFVRDRPFLEWMLRYPWVTTDRDCAHAEYFFDDYRQQAFYSVHELLEETGTEPAGWAITWFSARKGTRTLHVLDYKLRSRNVSAALLLVALREARRYRASRICIPAVCETDLHQLGPMGRLFSQRERRYFILAQPKSAASAALDEIRACYADGDLGFA